MGMFTEWRDDEIAKLRQQLQEARAENAALVAEFQRLADEPPTLEEIAADLDKIEMLEKELAEARDEIERLALEIENQQYTITCASEENQQLKESLAEARAEIEQLKSRNNASVSAHMWLIMRHAFTSGAYKGYAHGTEHKLLEQMFKEWCSKDYPEAAEKEVERLTEIERKDRLIEQMRETLLLFVEGAIHDFHYVCQHRDDCLCLACQKARVKAIIGGIWPGDESYFQNIRETALQDTIEQLTKELAEARAENAALVAEFQRLADEPPTLEEIAADLDKIEMLEKELAEARDEIERLALEIENQQYTITCASEENQQLKESLAEARAEIERKDKLIEQLKKALESAKQQHYVNDDDNWYSCPASGLCSNDSAGTDCNCGADYVNSIIEAALRAADGGE